MTPTETKLIEEGIRNEELALLEWVRKLGKIGLQYSQWWEDGITALSDEEVLDRFKNRNK